MPKPSLSELKDLCPQVDERLLQEHLARLEDPYFENFSLPDIARHVRALARLTPKHPAEVLMHSRLDDRVDCTILAFDYGGEFSLITGLLAGLAFSIQSGNVYTYARVPADAAAGPDLKRRRIVDHFSGTLDPETAFEDWTEEFRQRLKEIIGLLEQGGAQAVREAKHRVNEMVANRLEDAAPASGPVLYPMQISLDNDSGDFTRLKVVSQDTFAFLYALSNALSLKGIQIETVNIRTEDQRIEDELHVVDAQGLPLTDPDILDEVRLSVLLTKQFTHFLGKAPDPYAALSRFEHLAADVLRLPERGRWLDMFSNPRHLQDLARLLGASDFLWEDVIRLQYETLLPILKPHVEDRRFVEPAETIPRRLEEFLGGGDDPEERARRLNEFKDREIYLIDLDHILNPLTDFKVLAEHLTVLAEAVLAAAARLVYEQLARRFGTPRTIAGLPAAYALFGLGKFGGAALGYASDIELLFVYSDAGSTDGAETVENREFFERLARDTAAMIRAKREGIFDVDLRLRPYGADGPLACSLASFCDYYGAQGPAQAYERLALVRLRAIGGDRDLGARVERLRDEFLYASGRLNLAELREVRRKQLAEKSRPGRFNVKFSPGALVDLEYDVQILQVIYGGDHPELRTPRIHEALAALRAVGILGAGEREEVVAAYDFLRRLINGLRMLRGSARDLFLPAVRSDEYVHLARRLGYEPRAGLSPAQQLHLAFETHTAAVRTFVERHFGRDSLPGPGVGNVADLVLSEEVPASLQEHILAEAGFKQPGRAYANLRRLGEAAGSRETFARLAVLACDMLSQKPDPDMALNNWERFTAALAEDGPEKARAHFVRLHAQPMRLELLLSIFSASQFLADTLVRNPEFFEWVTDPATLQGTRSREDMRRELAALGREHTDNAPWLNALRRFRRRELLRVGTRDIALRAPLADITRDLSNLADALLEVALERAWQTWHHVGAPGSEAAAGHFCLFALGKLGGRELNYSSDVDLLGLCSDEGRAAFQAGKWGDEDPFLWVMHFVRTALSSYTEEGYIYRVDLRLRPYGQEGQLVPNLTGLADYYRTDAALPEIQALLKLRFVCGNEDLGRAFLERMHGFLLQKRGQEEIIAAVEKTRQAAMKQLALKGVEGTDVKTGLGGLRDIEFLVQGLQMIHAPGHPELLNGNTLEALAALEQSGLILPEKALELREDYIFLRRVEHYLQMLEDRQIHALPTDPQELEALSKRMLGTKTKSEVFMHDLNRHLRRVRNAYSALLLHEKANSE